MMHIHSATSVADLLLAAQAALRDVESGEEFTVRDLFRGFEWNRIPRGVRLQLGSVFNAYVKDPNQGGKLVSIGNKNAQNQQLYIKK